MSKLKNAIFGLSASGSISGGLTYLRRMRRQIVEKTPVLKDAKTTAQLSWRHMFLKVVALWHDLSPEEQAEWESNARPRHMTGYAWFVSQALRPNPGIYLPLQGGTMAGIIDMDGHRIEDLPDPPAPQDPATKAYHDANKYTDGEADARIALHAAIAAAHHARYTNGEADARIALHAAIAAAHHSRYTDAEVTAIANALIAVHAALVTGVHGAGDSVLATTLNIATHAAIAAVHHARYLDAEAAAVAAALIAIHASFPNIHHAPPAAGATLTVAETEVFNGAQPIIWTDLDLSGTIGANAALVFLKIKQTVAGASGWKSFRKNGDTDEFYGGSATYLSVASTGDARTAAHVVVAVFTDTDGKIEWRGAPGSNTITIDVMGYIK